MNKILQLFLNKFCFIYLNDILIYLNIFENHVKHLKTVLKILKKHQLYAKSDKCEVKKISIKFCDHILNNDQV